MEKEPEKIIELVHVKKIYRMGNEKIHAVDDVNFTINKGEFCCLLGTSGSGKSTLLNLMAGIEKATSGKIIIKGKNIPKMNENQLAKFRQKYLGFVFQSYNLINSMTAQENVEFPLVFKRVRPKTRKKLAKDMLVKVGLGNRLEHKPKEMSGGQQQRVGIARAFVAKPEIVFADEPTGNLDTKTTIEVMELIKQMARDNNQTIVMVTHDRSLAAYADKIIHILDGKIQSIDVVETSGQTDIKERLQDISRQILLERGGDAGVKEAVVTSEGAEESAEQSEEKGVSEKSTGEETIPKQEDDLQMNAVDNMEIAESTETVENAEGADMVSDLQNTDENQELDAIDRPKSRRRKE